MNHLIPEVRTSSKHLLLSTQNKLTIFISNMIAISTEPAQNNSICYNDVM